jgi:hypothetical protein
MPRNERGSCHATNVDAFGRIEGDSFASRFDAHVVAVQPTLFDGSIGIH